LPAADKKNRSRRGKKTDRVTEAIVLAGGQGKRLRPVVPDLPKPLAPVGGMPFLHHLLRYWRDQGIQRFILSIGHLGGLIAEALGDNFESTPIVYAQETAPLGTGGGLALAAGHLKSGGPFLVLNGDTYFSARLQILQAFHQEHQARLTLGLTQVARNSRFGSVELSADQRLRKLSAPGLSPWINAGVYLFEDTARDLLPTGGSPASLEMDLIPRWLAEQREIYGAALDGTFLDIGTPEDYARAAQVIAAGEPPRKIRPQILVPSGRRTG
jgi:D-glycero-alpha-D-manno-heptose 1-phosphate guanylyltransferase